MLDAFCQERVIGCEIQKCSATSENGFQSIQILNYGANINNSFISFTNVAVDVWTYVIDANVFLHVVNFDDERHPTTNCNRVRD